MKMLRNFAREWRVEDAAGRAVMALGVVFFLCVAAVFVCAIGWIWADPWSSPRWAQWLLTALVVGVGAILAAKAIDG